MRFSSFACLVLASAVAVDAFVPAAVVQKAKTSATASLFMTMKSTDDHDDSMLLPIMWGKAAMASVVCWGLMAQLASAATMAPLMLPASSVSFQETSIMSSQPTTLISAKTQEDTMDFAMPSYGEATKGDVTSNKFAPPSFNPFGDSKETEVVKAPESSTGQADAAAKKAADKADAAARQAAEKADAAARQAAEKAEAQQAAEKATADAEKKAAKEKQKAEDKAARRLAEIEKQKAYSERSKAEESSKSVTPDKAPDFDFKKPDMPAINIPDFKAPDIKAPDVSKTSFGMPKIDLPKMDMPKVDTPKMPKVEAPSGGGYDLDVPATKAPEASKFDMPKIGMPSIPKFDMPKIDMPKIDMPKMSAPSGGYDLDIPAPTKVDTPKVSLPSLPNPFGGGGGSSKSVDDTVVAPQEVRDESAREARGVYLDANQEAKDLEQKARELRDAANAKKQLANLAKDEACKTRPGGKILCLRNPFSAGF